MTLAALLKSEESRMPHAYPDSLSYWSCPND